MAGNLERGKARVRGGGGGWKMPRKVECRALQIYIHIYTCRLSRLCVWGGGIVSRFEALGAGKRDQSAAGRRADHVILLAWTA